jgi:DNA polymerase
MPSSNPNNRFIDYVLRLQESNCQNCRLGATRQNIAISRGNPLAKLMFISEAPGAEEDKTGGILVGDAGQENDRILLAAGINPDDCFFRNTVMCRPPGNRDPLLDEQQACLPNYQEMMEIAKPKVIVALGKVPAVYLNLMKSNESMRSKVGKWWESEDGKIKYTVLYHPAYLRRPNGRPYTQTQVEILEYIKNNYL